MHKFALGVKLQDKITGFTGIAIGRAEYLTGCTQYGLCPKGDGSKVLGNEWFDEGRLLIIDSGILSTDVKADQNGGPNRDAPNY